MKHLDHEVAELLRRDLLTGDRERILRHVASCPSCRAEWESISILAESGLRARPNVPDGYFATLPARILERRRRPRRNDRLEIFRAVMRPMLPVAAGALVVYALLSVSGTGTTSAGRLPILATEAAEYLATDITFASTNLAPEAEPLLIDRFMLLPEQLVAETGLEDLEPQTAAEVVEGLREEDIEALISKLSERVTL